MAARGHEQVALMIKIGGDAEIKPDLGLSFALKLCADVLVVNFLWGSLP